MNSAVVTYRLNYSAFYEKINQLRLQVEQLNLFFGEYSTIRLLGILVTVSNTFVTKHSLKHIIYIVYCKLYNISIM